MQRRTIPGATAAPLRAAPPLRAQNGFAKRTARVVVPFASGGPTGVFARRFVHRFQRALGQTVVIENTAGTGGALGARDVARSRPDGFSPIFHASSSALTSPLVYRRPLYNAVKDFEQVSLLGIAPFVPAIGPQTGARSTAELVAKLRERPGALSYGSSGVGTSNHLAGALFLARAGEWRAEHIGYRGANPTGAGIGPENFSGPRVASGLGGEARRNRAIHRHRVEVRQDDLLMHRNACTGHALETAHGPLDGPDPKDFIKNVRIKPKQKDKIHHWKNSEK
jgi:hypothetical protein